MSVEIVVDDFDTLMADRWIIDGRVGALIVRECTTDPAPPPSPVVAHPPLPPSLPGLARIVYVFPFFSPPPPPPPPAPPPIDWGSYRLPVVKTPRWRKPIPYAAQVVLAARAAERRRRRERGEDDDQGGAA